jgi:hypothetical protein
MLPMAHFVRAGDLSDERGFVHAGRVGAEGDTRAEAEDPAYMHQSRSHAEVRIDSINCWYDTPTNSARITRSDRIG